VSLGWWLCSWVCGTLSFSNKKRGKRHKLKHEKFHLNTRKNLVTLRVTEHWHRLPRGVVDSPSLEIFKTHLGKVLGILL